MKPEAEPMEKRYSVVIYPSEAVIALIKSMKEGLAREVGWFHSKNSVGHITICLFKATDKAIEKIKNQLRDVCDTLHPVEVCLNEFGSYPNGAFFIAPDQDSKNRLIPILKKVQEALPELDMQKNDDPHLSIARRLKPEKLERAERLFPLTELHFLCDHIVLRKFDETIKQFFKFDQIIRHKIYKPYFYPLNFSLCYF
jgi:2'-5' RNA ligase